MTADQDFQEFERPREYAGEALRTALLQGQK